MLADKKKKKVSKRNKRAWRKHTRVEDVENFLEEKRSDERLGVNKLGSKSDSELYLLDTEASDVKKIQGKPKSRAEKKLWALEPSPYQLALLPRSAVDDPIKRNRVRTKEERQHPARKAKNAELAARGQLRQSEMRSISDRKTSLIKRKKELISRKKVDFNSDLWGNEETNVDETWFSEDTLRQKMIANKEFKVKPPRDLTKRRSNLPSLELPHPGLSYNPSLADHKDLISKVVNKEVKMMKADAHIARVTAPFKVSSNKKQQNEWVEEVMQSLGISNGEQQLDKPVEIKEEEEDGGEVVTNTKTQPKMKTKKQRRIQLRLRDEAQQRKYAALEKKKISDIYQLKAIVSSLDSKAAHNEKKNAEKRKAKEDYASVGTKRLARLKFEEPLDEFSSAGELKGSLRKLRSHSTILKDRFYSLQKRNILQPTSKIFRSKKRKVKVVIKRDHRIEEQPTVKSKTKNKMKIFTTSD